MSGDGGEAAAVASRTADSTSIDSAARLLRTVVLSLLSSFTCASLEPARGVCCVSNNEFKRFNSSLLQYAEVARASLSRAAAQHHTRMRTSLGRSKTILISLSTVSLNI